MWETHNPVRAKSFVPVAHRAIEVGKVESVLAIVAPGQGAQQPGFLTPWLADANFAEHLGELSEASKLDLASYGTEADADTIRDTAIAQPLLVASAIATAKAIAPDAMRTANLLAGHSVGEIAVAAGAGVLDEHDAMVLVAERGRAMAAASALEPTSMTAVIGGKPDEVLAAIETAGLTAANNNGSGQIVAAGSAAELDSLAQNPPNRARLIPLSVAGAFHTKYMAPAVETLEQLTGALDPADPATRLLSNSDGAVVDSGADFLKLLVRQVANPVRWDLCMATMADLGVTGLLELTPAGTLTGIAKRNLKTTETFALNTPDQLDEARDFCQRHLATA